MADELIIPKNRRLEPATDYHFLREAGLAYIEQIAHGRWTDYNSHDPGITMLEAICYAITELGYRCSFDIKDLLADGSGGIGTDQAFFTPRKILTNEAYTTADYRKLLIDLPGVANAWVYPAINDPNEDKGVTYVQTEVPLYPECSKDRLTYRPTDHEPADLRGLYHVRLDLDETDDFGDLNSSNLIFPIYSAGLQGARLELFLPRYDAVDFTWLSDYYRETPKNITVTPVKADAFGRTTRWLVLLLFENEGKASSFQFEAAPALKLPVVDFEALVQSELEEPLTQQRILELFFHKTRLIRTTVQRAWECLHAHRNLCEDWWTVRTISNRPVAICADLDLRPEADTERVYAAIVVAIGRYLNPPVRFYTLQELLDSDTDVADIFEGPKLQHGFLRSDEVAEASLRARIYVSDLINLIMDIDGVIAVRNVQLTGYDDTGKAMLPSQKWCLHIDPDHKPVLDESRSKLLFYKAGLPLHINRAEAADTILYLRGLLQGKKLLGAALDLALPTGRHYALDSYSSLQHDLPDTYGVGPAGLPDNASPDRRSRAKQLKAYLLFFDQLLAGFFSQLQHSRSLLGLNANLAQTYFQQYLHDWKEDPETGIHNVADIYADDNLLRTILEAPQPGEDPAASRARSVLLETEAGRHERRNRFLDHLLARFAENFHEYALLQFRQGEAADKAELIADKIRLIKDLPQAVGRRGTAQDLLGERWDTTNIAGLQQRIARLCGINDPGRRSLFCHPPADIVNEGSPAAPRFTFTLQDAHGNAWLRLPQPHPFYAQAERALNETYENLLAAAQYGVREEAGLFHVVLHGSDGSPVAAGLQTFDAEADAVASVEEIIAAFTPACEEEGLHLIEHFLLRPYFHPGGNQAESDYRLLKVCLPDDCLFCGEEDPYSFRVTAVLPYWPARFRDADFRRFFEHTIRREAPAHVHVKVCWINFTQMRQLESAYRGWLGAVQEFRKDQAPDAARRKAVRLAGNELIGVLDGLRSIFPEATLHDCAEGTTNPVRLGQTSLGTG